MPDANAADKPRFLVVGGGLAGLMTVIKIAEAGHDVDVFSLVPCRRSHSVCAQGGINGAVNTKGEGDSPEVHFKDTVKGGDFLADQPPVKAMCDAAPGIIYLLDRMGVPFSRTPEGLIDFRRFGGTLHHRTAFAGATTGQQLLYALDEQVRRFEVEGRVRRFEYHELVSLVRDDAGRCRGIVVMDLRGMKLSAHAGACVALGTGGPGLIFGKTTNSTINTGSAAAIAFQQGARYANGEFIQVHPTSIPGSDKLRLMSESLRGEGGRVWVPRQRGDKRPGQDIPEKERWYFLEEKYPIYQNLVPRDIASREIFDIVVNQGMGVGGERFVYLDLTHLPAQRLHKLEGVLEIYEKFVGDDPRKVPMKVFPAVHYSMGGLWVDFERSATGSVVMGSPRNQATSIPGLYAVGEVDYQYHGANRLGANSLLSCIWGGMIAGPAMATYRRNVARSAWDLPSSLFDKAEKRETKKFEAILAMDGDENPYALHEELAHTMLVDCTIERHNPTLERVLAKVEEIDERARRVGVTDKVTGKMNQGAQYVRHLQNMIVLARVIAQGALARNESRGAHYKPEFPQRDDANWLRTTLAFHQGATNGTPAKVRYVREFDYTMAGQRIHVTDAVDVSLVRPRPRKYETAGAASAAAKGQIEPAKAPLSEKVAAAQPQAQAQSEGKR